LSARRSPNDLNVLAGLRSDESGNTQRAARPAAGPAVFREIQLSRATVKKRVGVKQQEWEEYRHEKNGKDHRRPMARQKVEYINNEINFWDARDVFKQILTRPGLAEILPNQPHYLIDLKRKYPGVIHVLCRRLEQEVALRRAKIAAKEEKLGELRFRREKGMQLEAWWAHVKNTLYEFNLGTNRAFSSITQKILLWQKDCERWHDSYLARLSTNNFAQEISQQDITTMHHINLVLLDMVEGCEHIRQKAHFVRLYRRARHRCSLDPVAFSYVMKHSHLKEVTGLLHISARLLRLRAATCDRIFLSYKPDRAYRPNVLTHRCEMIERNVADILQIMTGFDFGVL
jgi:hypothetical protein